MHCALISAVIGNTGSPPSANVVGDGGGVGGVGDGGGGGGGGVGTANSVPLTGAVNIADPDTTGRFGVGF